MLWPLFHQRQQICAGGQVRVGAAELLRVRLPRCEQSPPPGSSGCACNTCGGGLIHLTGRQRIIPGVGAMGSPVGSLVSVRCSFTQLTWQRFFSLPAAHVGPVSQLCPCPQPWSELEPTRVSSPAPRALICPAILSAAQLCAPGHSGTEGEGPAHMATAQARPPDAQTPAGMESWTRTREQPSRGPAHSAGPLLGLPAGPRPPGDRARAPRERAGPRQSPPGHCPCPSAVSARNPSEESTGGLPAVPRLWTATWMFISGHGFPPPS